MRSRWHTPAPTRADREAALTLWLHNPLVRDEVILSANAATLAHRHGLDARVVEVKLLARQAVLRRQRGMCS